GGRRGMIAGAIVALHPALFLYTPAVMTEGIVTSLVAVAAAIASLDSLRPRVRLVLGAAILGIATLVRPQSLMLAPFLVVFVWDGWRARVVGAAAAVLV